MAFKPHLGILIPITLIAMRQWPAFAAAILTASLFIVTSALVYGMDAWLWFWETTMPHQMRYMPGWFMAGRLVGLPFWLAQAIQAAVALGAAVLVCRVFAARGVGASKYHPFS